MNVPRVRLAMWATFAFALALLCVSLHELSTVDYLLPSHSLRATNSQHLWWWPGVVVIGLASLFAMRDYRGGSEQAPTGWADVRWAVGPILLASLSAWLVDALGPVSFFLTYGMLGIWAYRMLQDISLEGKTHRWVLVLLGVCIVAIFCWTVYLQHHLFYSMTFGISDIGYWHMRLRNTVLHGDFLRLDSDLPRYWDHYCPGLALLLPFHLLYPKIELLFWVQSFCVMSSVVAAIWVARKKGLSWNLASLVGLVFCFYPATTQVIFGNTYGFHTNSMAMPLLVVFYYFLDARKIWQAVVLAIIIMSLKEYMGIYVAAGGIALLVSKRWKSGSFFFFSGMLVSAYLLFVYLPGLVEEEFIHGSWFGELGQGTEVILSPILKPALFWGRLFSPSNGYFLLEALLPVGLLMVYAPRWALALLVPTSLYFVSAPEPAKTIIFHYHTCTIAIIVYGMIDGLTTLVAAQQSDSGKVPSSDAEAIGRRSRIWKLKPAPAMLAILLVAIMLSKELGMFPYADRNISIIPRENILEDRREAARAMLEAIPLDATVWGEERVTALLLDRRYVLVPWSRRPMDMANYVVILAGEWGRSKEQTLVLIQQYVRDPAWELHVDHYPIAVFKRRIPAPPPGDDVY